MKTPSKGQHVVLLANRSNTALAALFTILSCVLVSGCGSDVVDVTGVVTIDGKPLSAGKIYFSPEGPGRPAVGKIDQDGQFRLATDGHTGIVPGKYQAYLAYPNPQFVEGGMGAAQKNPIPQKYLSKGSLELEFLIANDDANYLEISLEKE